MAVDHALPFLQHLPSSWSNRAKNKSSFRFDSPDDGCGESTTGGEERYLATGVGGGDDDRTTANCCSGTAPDELLTSSRISARLSLLSSSANWGKE
jgi:hypothetical protein